MFISEIEESRYALMAKTYQITFTVRMVNMLATALLRAGIRIHTMSLLTVRGRKSGQPHSVPVTLVEQGSQRWLVAPYGAVQWVRNLRAAGTATLTRGRRSEAISVTELPAQEAAPILKQYLLKATAARPTSMSRKMRSWRLLSVRHRVTRSFRSRWWRSPQDRNAVRRRLNDVADES